MQRNISLLAALSLLLIVAAGSCKKEEPEVKPEIEEPVDTTTHKSPPPTIAVTGGADKAAPGDELIYFVSLQSLETELAGFEVKTSVNGSAAGIIHRDTFSDVHNRQFSYNYVVSNSFKDGDEITLIFTVTDRKNITNVATRTINVKYAAGEINTYTAKLLGGASNPNAGSFFDAHTGSVMFTADANANPDKVDIIYYYTSTNYHAIAAPDDVNIAQAHTSVATWATRNATRYKMTSVTKAQFDAAVDDALIAVEADGANQTKVNDMTAGEVFAFITADDKKGLVYVVSIGGTHAGERNMVMDVKVQK